MNQYGLYTPTAGASSADNTATNVGKFDILLSTNEFNGLFIWKALIEFTKSCSAAMHKSMHLVTGNIDNGKSTT